jgi:hypothetical protein
MVMDIRAEIARVSAEHDKLMREDAQWLAHREAERKALMRKFDDETVLYRTTENALAHAPTAAPTPSDAAHGLFGDERDAMLANAMGQVIAHERRLHAAAFAKRDARIAKLETQVETLLALLGGDKKVGQKCHDDSVVELPKFLRRTHAA